MAEHPKPVRDIDEEFKRRMRLLPCLSCGAPPPSTISHIKTRGSGGDDQAHNIVPQCLHCHMEWETNKPKFIREHPHFAEHLKKLGWQWWSFYGIFRLVRRII